MTKIYYCDKGFIMINEVSGYNAIPPNIVIVADKTEMLLTDIPDNFYTLNQIAEQNMLKRYFAEDICSITTLIFNNNILKSIRNIPSFNFIKKIDFSRNFLRNLDGIEKLINLECLIVSDNLLEDISAIEKTNLKIIDLSNNKLTDVTPLHNSNRLHRLNLSNNKLTKLIGCENLKKLSVLAVNNNELTDFTGINCLESLQHLYARNNKIVNILDDFMPPKLISLNIEKNEINQIDISKLYSLTVITLTVPKDLEHEKKIYSQIMKQDAEIRNNAKCNKDIKLSVMLVGRDKN